MARCEDFPCCGHDICPDFDENGRQLNMKCVCGATLPLNSRYSICESCLNTPGPEDDPYDYMDSPDQYLPDEDEIEEAFEDDEEPCDPEPSDGYYRTVRPIGDT